MQQIPRGKQELFQKLLDYLDSQPRKVIYLKARDLRSQLDSSAKQVAYLLSRLNRLQDRYRVQVWSKSTGKGRIWKVVRISQVKISQASSDSSGRGKGA